MPSRIATVFKFPFTGDSKQASKNRWVFTLNSLTPFQAISIVKKHQATGIVIERYLLFDGVTCCWNLGFTVTKTKRHVLYRRSIVAYVTISNKKLNRFTNILYCSIKDLYQRFRFGGLQLEPGPPCGYIVSACPILVDGIRLNSVNHSCQNAFYMNEALVRSGRLFVTCTLTERYSSLQFS